MGDHCSRGVRQSTPNGAWASRVSVSLVVSLYFSRNNISYQIQFMLRSIAARYRGMFVCLLSAAVCTVAKRSKLDLWCVQKSNTNVATVDISIRTNSDSLYVASKTGVKLEKGHRLKVKLRPLGSRWQTVAKLRIDRYC